MKQEKEYTKMLQEVNNYRDPSFPVGIYVVTKDGIEPDGRGYKDLHWHEELQMTYVVSGQLKIRVNSLEYDLCTGEAIYINRNLLHVTTELTDDGAYISLDYPDRLLSFYPGSRMEQNDVLPFTMNVAFPALIFRPDIPWQKEIIQLLTEMIQVFQEDQQNGHEYEIAMNLTRMWHIMITNVRDQIQIPSQSYIRKQNRVQSLLLYIHNHYMDEITLEDMADQEHISVGECCRCFQEMIGQSPKKYLLKYRIARGMELLTTTDLSVTEIALEVGFNHSSHFIDYFKKSEGMTPNEYRKSKSQR